MSLNLDLILKANLREKSNKVNVSFKKTLQVKQYEPVTYEISNELTFDKDLDNIDKAVIENLLLNSLEYIVLCHIYKKNLIDKDEFSGTKQELELSTEAMLVKYEKLTGKSRDSLLGGKFNE